ncbi:MAG: uL15 family ribosomal protein, partial [Clostridia bacterium]|nr:uL15 family ribosomal protein [Clostridia bacterium]
TPWMTNGNGIEGVEYFNNGSKCSAFCVNITVGDELTVEPASFTATFVADGTEVAKVPFLEGDKELANVPEVPAKEGFTGEWEDYTLGAKDITVNAVYTPEKGGMSFWWWILIILAIIVIAVVIFFIFKMNNHPDEPTPEPEPVVEPEPEPEEPVVAPVIEEVDDVAADEVDDLMSDDDALAGVVTAESDAPAEGQRAIINVGTINDNFVDGETVNLEVLKAKKLVPAKAGRLKVLADGHLNKHPLTVEANSFSVQAIKMIQLTGGTVIQKR